MINVYLYIGVGNDYFQLDVTTYVLTSTICDVYVYCEKLTDAIETTKQYDIWFIDYNIERGR